MFVGCAVVIDCGYALVVNVLGVAGITSRSENEIMPSNMVNASILVCVW